MSADRQPGGEDAAAADDGIRTVLVVGAGTMGQGIAQVVAEAGPRTVLIDADPASQRRGLDGVHAAWSRAVAKERRTAEQVDAARDRLVAGDGPDDARDADLVIEAIVEDLDAKSALLARLSAAAPPSAIVASNTSSISITRLAAATDRPERVIGLHFFNPVPVLPLVEVVRGLLTDGSTRDRATAFARRIGKTPVEVNDFPGFVSNRVLMPMINEAIFCLGEGVADATAIDQVMQLGMAHPIGPLALADLIGLDVCLDILLTLQRDIGDDKYRPAPLLRRLVAARKLGRKSGEGLFRYDGGTADR